MINPWFKFYGSEYLSDQKIASLSPQERSCWITLLCLSSTSSVPGVVEYLTVEVLLNKSGVMLDPYNPEEWDRCLSVLAKFERMRMITLSDNGTIEIVNWNKRQESAMSVTERVRKHRLKSKAIEVNVTDVTLRNKSVTIEENRIEKNRLNTNTFFIKNKNTDSILDTSFKTRGEASKWIVKNYNSKHEDYFALEIIENK